MPASNSILSVTTLPTAAASIEALVENRSELWANGEAKRFFDFTLSMTAVLATAPLLGVIAIVVKVTSPGPVMFRQQRMGMEGRSFTILKFRTMKVADGPLVTARNDTRITSVGRLLRRAKLDELPQLLNVMRGDMSFVGPRPKIVEHQLSKLICRPGLTGAATLAFIEEEKMLTSIPEQNLETYVVEVLHRIKADVDHEYALTSSLWSDVRLLSSTLLHLLKVRRSRRMIAMMHRIERSASRTSPDLHTRFSSSPKEVALRPPA